MSQQRDDSGAQSMPQQLVQLVGCRDLKADGPRMDSPRMDNAKAGKLKARAQLKR
jgi:hypothetical protein